MGSLRTHVVCLIYSQSNETSNLWTTPNDKFLRQLFYLLSEYLPEGRGNPFYILLGSRCLSCDLNFELTSNKSIPTTYQIMAALQLFFLISKNQRHNECGRNTELLTRSYKIYQFSNLSTSINGVAPRTFMYSMLDPEYTLYGIFQEQLIIRFATRQIHKNILLLQDVIFKMPPKYRFFVVQFLLTMLLAIGLLFMGLCVAKKPTTFKALQANIQRHILYIVHHWLTSDLFI